MNAVFIQKNKYVLLGFVLVFIAISSCSNAYEFALYNIEGVVKDSPGLIPLKISD